MNELLGCEKNTKKPWRVQGSAAQGEKLQRALSNTPLSLAEHPLTAAPTHFIRDFLLQTLFEISPTWKSIILRVSCMCLCFTLSKFLPASFLTWHFILSVLNAAFIPSSPLPLSDSSRQRHGGTKTRCVMLDIQLIQGHTKTFGTGNRRASPWQPPKGMRGSVHSGFDFWSAGGVPSPEVWVLRAMWEV